jgi:cellulase/cellobiase CelA1
VRPAQGAPICPASQSRYTLTGLRNIRTTAFNSWRLSWTFANGQVITTLFGANYTPAGANVTATSLPWNSVIQPGSDISNVGFYASWNNVTNSIPQMTCETG